MRVPHHIGHRPTWARINLAHLAYNFRLIRKRLTPDIKILVTVKADAYGHGLIPVSRQLCALGVDMLGVASVDEGIALRAAGIKVPVVILGIILRTDVTAVVKYRLSATVCDEAIAVSLNTAAARRRIKAPVHVKVDTGMGRIGVQPENAAALIGKISRLKALDLQGVFTHLACADCDALMTGRQITMLNTVVAGLRRDGIAVPFMHAANSCATLEIPASHGTMVRPGLAIYGLHSRRDTRVRLKPVLSLRTRVVFVKRVEAGCGISYGHTYKTARRSTIITLPIGYGDGYPRNLSNKAPVVLHGKRFTISGRICMDQMMVDIGDEPVRVGDEVVLIGRQKGAQITAEELAELAGTIPYEIVCGLGSRIPRVYK